VLGALAASYGFGVARLPEAAALTDTQLRIVQPNISQSQKWTQQGRLDSLRVHAELSRLPTDAPPASFTIWSETAMPFTLYSNSVWPSRLATLIPPNTTLITGAVRADDAQEKIQIWNSVVAVDAQANVLGHYDKHQLVPFGEFVPLRSVLPLDKITPGNIDFSRGKGPQALQIGTIPPFSPLVCYEVIFPWIAVDAANRPAWILNVTNDAWYGDSPGPYQHFAISRMRAIEQGLPLVRAANTGISAVVDPYGRAVKFLKLGTRGVIDQALPKPLPPTFYAKQGEWLVLLLLVGLWIFTEIRLRVRNS
jgi:apolipoprotein N-acyltransferase